MAKLPYSNSVRNLPQGRMNDIRKMFEKSPGEGADDKPPDIKEESDGFVEAKQPTPAPRGKPAITSAKPVIPSAKPVYASSTKSVSGKPSVPGTKPQLKDSSADTQNQSGLVNGLKKTEKEIQKKTSEAEFKPRPMYAVPKKKLNPALSQKIEALQTGGSNKENEKVKPPLPPSPAKHLIKPSFNQKPVSEGSQDRNSDPVSPPVPRIRHKSKEQIEQEKQRRKSAPESPKRNVNQHGDKNTEDAKSNQFSFPQESKDGGKTRITTLSPTHQFVRRQNSIGTARELKHSPLHAGVSPFSFSRSNPPLPASQPPSSIDKPAPMPPRKPPRTHAHDDYLKTKLKVSHNSKEVVILEDDEDKFSTTSVVMLRKKDNEEKIPNKPSATHHVTKPIPKDPSGTHLDAESPMEAGYTSIKDRISKLHQDDVIKRGPPARPPPPKQRPFSVATDNMSSLSKPSTPVRIGRHVPARKPFSEGDDTIAEEDSDEELRSVNSHMVMSMVDEWTQRPVQRFPLRKSFSSDDLYKAGLGDPVYMDPVEALWSRDDTYEAFVDESGYAVPNKFVKRQLEAKRSLDSSAMPIRTALKAKFGDFRKIFASEATPVKPRPVPIQEQDPYKVNKRRMSQIRLKLNQAFSALQKYVRGRGDHLHEDTEDRFKDLDTLSIDSDFVDVAEIQRRVEYVSSVRARTKKSIKKTKEFLSKIYPQLFEYALMVGLRPVSGSAGYKPYVIHKFPETRAYKVGQDGNLFACTGMVDSNVSVPLFCFPDAQEYKPSAASESYSFVLTNIDGERVYGYCRRLKPLDSKRQEVICIISPIDAFNMYNKLLDEIEKRRLISVDLAQELIAASFGRPLSGPGKVVHIRTLDQDGDMETLFLNRSSDSRRENVNYECLLNYLGTDKLIKVFSSLMMERRVLLCSNSLSCLTQTVHALVALLYPFCWQHIYIPILPPDMLDVCASPTPYLIGILRSHLPQVLEEEELLEEVVIVDLDKKQFVRSLGDESTLLPKKLQKALKTAINMCKIDNDPESSQWLMVSEAFMRLFIEIMGHFGEFITTQQDGRKVFDKERFLSSVTSKGIRQVLEWFTETQMFEVFITNQKEKSEWGTVDLFMNRLMEFHRDDTRDSHVGFGRKMKNLGKVIKTKFA